MNLPLIKMLGSVMVVAIYFAAVVVSWVVSHNVDMMMATSFFGLVLAGGAIMGINVIED